MSHRGICPWCGKVIWMGQPVIQIHTDYLHDDCAEWYAEYCWYEICQPQRYITREMAMDAGDLSLEGMPC